MPKLKKSLEARQKCCASVAMEMFWSTQIQVNFPIYIPSFFDLFSLILALFSI